MRTYLLVTGVIFGLLAVWHVLELIHGFRTSASDTGFLLGVGAVIVLSAALSAWAFTLLKSGRTPNG